MTPLRLLRTSAWVFPLLAFLLAAPNAALGQAAAQGPRVLAPEARARLVQAAGDSRVAPWQRDVMLHLARTGTNGEPDSTAGEVRSPRSARASGAVDGVWTELTPSGTAPSAGEGYSAIYDPLRDRMVVFGGGHAGAYVNDAWALSLGGTPAWTQLAPTGTLPGGRAFHSAIYDPVRDRMLVFGGLNSSGTYNNGVWALSLAGTTAWALVSPSGTRPSVRAYQSAIYDPIHDWLVVFGGYAGAGSNSSNDTWALSLGGAPSWMLLTPGGTLPSARWNHSAIYDPVRERMVVFAGASGTFLNDVWTLSLNPANTLSWTQATPTGMPPAGSREHSAIYDPARDRMVVFGGHEPTGDVNDVWSLALADTPAWTLGAPSGTLPSARHNHSAIYDPLRKRMVVFGGIAGSYVNDVWALSLPDASPPDVTAPTVQVQSPNGGEWLLTGSTVDITWSATDDIGVQSVDISLSRSGSLGPWESLVSDAPNSGSYSWLVSGPNAIDTAYVMVLARDAAGNSASSSSHAAFTVSATPAAVPPAQAVTAFALSPLSPNPVRGRSVVTYAIPVRTHVRLALTDVQGREVTVLADGMREPGRYAATVDAGSLRAGMYFVRMQAKSANLTRRVVVLK